MLCEIYPLYNCILSYCRLRNSDVLKSVFWIYVNYVKWCFVCIPFVCIIMQFDSVCFTPCKVIICNKMNVAVFEKLTNSQLLSLTNVLVVLFCFLPNTFYGCMSMYLCVIS